MPAWFYSWPAWGLGGVMVGAWLLAGVVGHTLCRHWWREPLGETERFALRLMGAIAASSTALLLVYAVGTAWEASDRATQAVRHEAAAITDLGRSLGVIHSAESRLARERLKAYTRSVVYKEWPAMREAHNSLGTWDAFDGLYRSMADIQPVSTAERALMPEVWRRMHDLLWLRYARMETSQAQLPGAIWVVLLVSTSMSLGSLCVLPQTRHHRWLIGLASLAAGLLFFLVATLDRPLLLRDSPTQAPFEASLSSMERWEATAGFGGE